MIFLALFAGNPNVERLQATLDFAQYVSHIDRATGFAVRFPHVYSASRGEHRRSDRQAEKLDKHVTVEYWSMSNRFRSVQ